MNACSTKGFTLIEMVIVVLVMAILATAATPSYLALRDRNALRSSAEQMLAVLAEQRLRAVKENQAVEVNFDPVLDLVAERVDVKENTLGDIVIDPRLAMLTDATQAGSVDFVLGEYGIRFGVTPVGQGFICSQEGVRSTGYPACDQ